MGAAANKKKETDNSDLDFGWQIKYKTNMNFGMNLELEELNIVHHTELVCENVERIQWTKQIWYF